MRGADGPRLARYPPRQGGYRLARARGPPDRGHPRAAARCDGVRRRRRHGARPAVAVGKAALFVGAHDVRRQSADAPAARRDRQHAVARAVRADRAHRGGRNRACLGRPSSTCRWRSALSWPGVVVSDSPFSHQIGADLLPFREAFAVVFFVSVGMLVDPVYVLAHWDRVLIITFVIVVVKGLVSGLLGAVLPTPARTALVLAAGRGQIGEFSFIVGHTGVALGSDRQQPVPADPRRRDDFHHTQHVCLPARRSCRAMR